jgi:hypothetical protein
MKLKCKSKINALDFVCIRDKFLMLKRHFCIRLNTLGGVILSMHTLIGFCKKNKNPIEF